MAKTNIDLNTASVDELAKLPMVGRERAEKIIQKRDEMGGFKSWKDLDDVPGLSSGMIDDIRESGATIGSEGESSSDEW